MSSKLHDVWSFSRTISLFKAFNAIKLIVSYYYSRLTGKPAPKGLPASMSIEPTTACNLRCPQCPSGLRSFTRPTGFIDLGLYQKIIDESAMHLAYLMLYFQGEPYLHPHFFDMVKYASDKKIYTATSTNGHFLSDAQAEATVKSGLNRLIISIDGSTQESYAKYRIGGSLNKVLEGAANLARQKKILKSKKPYVIFQFVVFSHNEHEIAEARQQAHAAGADEIVFKTAQIYDYANGSKLIPTQGTYSRYQKSEQGGYEIKNKLMNHCWKLWHGCVVTRDGTVVPCCFDKDATYEMGNLKTETLQEIWYNEAYFNFRSHLMVSRKEIDICRNCTEGTKVWT